MSNLLSYLAITGVVASAGINGEVPPVPDLSPPPAVADAATNSSSIAGSEIITDFIDDGSTPVGIDISSHQHNGGSRLNVQEVVAGGQDFAIIKATEGTHYINPHFRPDTVNFISEGKPVGFYHYARPSSDPEDAREEARFFVEVTGMNIGVKSLPPVLDIEEHEGLSSRELITWTHTFVDEIKELTGRDTMIYTYPWFWENRMANTTEFNHLPLWIAHYTDNGEPGRLPGGWTDWVFWQHTDSGTIPGARGDIDQNEFSGTLTELHEIYTSSVDGNDVVENVMDTVSNIATSSAPQFNVIEEIEFPEPQIQEIVIPGQTQSSIPELKTLMETFSP